jgi:hypothetical protein
LFENGRVLTNGESGHNVGDFLPREGGVLVLAGDGGLEGVICGGDDGGFEVVGPGKREVEGLFEFAGQFSDKVCLGCSFLTTVSKLVQFTAERM